MKDDPLSQYAQAALRERVKELMCLYGIAQIAGTPGVVLDEILQGIVEILPPAWQYPEISSARITLDGRSFEAPGFRDCRQKQTAEIVVDGESRGTVEVVYAEEKPELDEGPFLEEERNLIDGIARQVALIVERKRAEEERSKLQSQLLHADRLATIGLLAAGVAHELNEPLGNILGFAQLARKCPGLPESARGDIEKIESASLQAREIIKDLLVFARQMPPEKVPVSLNEVVQGGLHFFQARCTKEGVELVCNLAPGLPSIKADPAQLNQVLVNLVVNALHAMPRGGTLTVRTCADADDVCLIVEDTGIGMSEETLAQAFIPFYTTKDVGQGTGLGLPVVHGIVTSHGGSIETDSQVGRGARFVIRLPVQGSRGAKNRRRTEGNGR